MEPREIYRISDNVVFVPLPEEAEVIDFSEPAQTNYILLEILHELKEMNAQLKHGVTVYTDDSISVYVTNHLDI